MTVVLGVFEKVARCNPLLEFRAIQEKIVPAVLFPPRGLRVVHDTEYPCSATN